MLFKKEQKELKKLFMCACLSTFAFVTCITLLVIDHNVVIKNERNREMKKSFKITDVKGLTLVGKEVYYCKEFKADEDKDKDKGGYQIRKGNLIATNFFHDGSIGYIIRDLFNGDYLCGEKILFDADLENVLYRLQNKLQKEELEHAEEK